MTMDTSLLDRYVESLLEGRRVACRAILREALCRAAEASQIYETLLWPAMERVDRLFRQHRITAASEHMATRINRAIADQLQLHLVQRPCHGRRVIITCADGEPEELGAQMCSDLFEADGWEVYFVGGGVPNDELLTLVGTLRPELLLLFGTQPQGAPRVRQLIDMIREVDAHPSMNIMISGGVFNRATGLWKEVNADLFAPTVGEALMLANTSPKRVSEPRSFDVPKKRPRRRRTLELAPS